MNIARTMTHIVIDMSKRDRLFWQQRYWIPLERDNKVKGYHLQNESDPELYKFISFEELYAALKVGVAKVSYGYHAPVPSLIRAVFGDKRLKDFKDEWVQLARHKEQIILLYEEHLRENGKLSRAKLKSKLEDWNDKANRLRAKGAKKTGVNSQTGSAIIVFDEAPNDRTFLDYYNDYLKFDRDIRSLLPRHHGPGKHHRLHRSDPESLAIWTRHAHRYVDSSRPSKFQLREECTAEISKLNEARKANGYPVLLKEPGRKQFENLINAMDAYHVMAGRDGTAKAMAYFRGQMTGFDIERPGERVEFDNYLLELQTWLSVWDLWDKLDGETRSKLKPVRVYLSMARDAYTGYIMAVKWSKSENSAAVVDTLDMAISDKCHAARFVGAETDWYGGVRIQSAESDNGPAYTADLTHDAFRESGISLSHPPAGQPWHRPFIESVLAVISRMLLGYFDGRTFANPVDKGDYDAEGRATLSVDEAVCLIIRGILDYYHHKVNYRTKKSPHDAWLDYLEETGAQWGGDPEMRISVFGVSSERRIQADGIYVWGIRYQSGSLQALRKSKNPKKVEVRFHRDDLRWISVRYPDGHWFLVENRARMKEQITVEEWIMVRRALENDANEAQLPMLPRMYKALTDVRGSNEAARIRARLSPSTLTAEELAKQERELFGSLHLSEDDLEEEVLSIPANLPSNPLRSGGVVMTRPEGKRPPTAENETSNNPENTETDNDEGDYR